jgi:hypothetical protein
MSDVLIVRLFTGEEILGEVTFEDSSSHVVIKHPTRIQAAPNPNTGNVDVHLAPLLPLAQEKEIKLRMDAIAFYYTPVVDIRNQFSTLFGSGILLPA